MALHHQSVALFWYSASPEVSCLLDRNHFDNARTICQHKQSIDHRDCEHYFQYQVGNRLQRNMTKIMLKG